MAEKGHESHPSLAMLEEMAAGKKMTSFWEAMSTDPDVVYYQKKKKAKKGKKKKKKDKKDGETAPEPKEEAAAPAGPEEPAQPEQDAEPPAPEAEEAAPPAAEEAAPPAAEEAAPAPAAEEAAPAAEEAAAAEPEQPPAPAAEEAAPPAAEDAPPAIVVEDLTKTAPAAEPAKEEAAADPQTGTRDSIDRDSKAAAPEQDGEKKEEEAPKPAASLALPQGAGQPSFTDAFFPTSDTHIREFSFIDLDQMVAQLQDEAKQEESGNLNPKQTVTNLKPEEDVTMTNPKELEKLAPEVPDQPEDAEDTGEYTMDWETRPLGIEVVRGHGGLNAWVRRVLNKDLEDKIKKGSYIVKVTSTNSQGTTNTQTVLGESYSRILKIISRVQGKITITFDENPKLDPVIPVGSMVRLTNLNRETTLNGCVGFIFAEMVDGRYPVKLAETGDQVGVKPKNVTLLEEAPSNTKNNGAEKTAFDLSGNYELIKTMGMNKFLRAQGMSWFKTKLRFNPKLTINIVQDGNSFGMTFAGPKGAITDNFVANKSTFRGKTFSALNEAFKSAVIINDELHITELNRAGEKKTIVFKKPDQDNMTLTVTNPAGVSMTQSFRLIQQG